MVSPRKMNFRLFVADSVLDGLDLDSDHGQNLHADSVEFVKAAPSTGLCKTFVDVANRLNERERERGTEFTMGKE